MLRLDQELERLETDERHRPGPDAAQIDEWSVATHLAVWEHLSASKA